MMVIFTKHRIYYWVLLLGLLLVILMGTVGFAGLLGMPLINVPTPIIYLILFLLAGSMFMVYGNSIEQVKITNDKIVFSEIGVLGKRTLPRSLPLASIEQLEIKPVLSLFNTILIKPKHRPPIKIIFLCKK